MVDDLKGAHYLTLQQQYGLMLATYRDAPPGAPQAAAAAASTDADSAAQNVYIMSLEMDGAGACSGLLAPDDRVIEVDGVPTEGLQQVTAAFRESKATVRVKVASRVVHGGFLNKKGEFNTEAKPRWFVLSDELDGPVLRYYEGRNSVTRLFKGEIRINPEEVQSVRHFNHDGADGQKTLGMRIATPSRTWELVGRTPAEVRQWVELLNARVRQRTARSSVAALDGGGSDAQQAASVNRAAPPQSTRL